VRPNLFDYATKELSHDAFLCWLLLWGNAEHATGDDDARRLNKCAVGMLRLFGVPQGADEIRTVSVERQYKKIDVLCTVNGQHLVAIENKIDTSHHGHQLEKYRKVAIERAGRPENVSLVYYKIHDFGPDDESVPPDYNQVSRSMILGVMTDDIGNAIYADYRCFLTNLERRYTGFLEIPLANWGKESWMAFYRALSEELGGDPPWKWQGKSAGFDWVNVNSSGVRLQFRGNDLQIRPISELWREPSKAQLLQREIWRGADKAGIERLKIGRKSWKGWDFLAIKLPGFIRASSDGTIDFDDIVRRAWLVRKAVTIAVAAIA
jgi:hypothetical protein